LKIWQRNPYKFIIDLKFTFNFEWGSRKTLIGVELFKTHGTVLSPTDPTREKNASELVFDLKAFKEESTLE